MKLLFWYLLNVEQVCAHRNLTENIYMILLTLRLYNLLLSETLRIFRIIHVSFIYQTVEVTSVFSIDLFNGGHSVTWLRQNGSDVHKQVPTPILSGSLLLEFPSDSSHSKVVQLSSDLCLWLGCALWSKVLETRVSCYNRHQWILSEDKRKNERFAWDRGRRLIRGNHSKTAGTGTITVIRVDSRDGNTAGTITMDGLLFVHGLKLLISSVNKLKCVMIDQKHFVKKVFLRSTCVISNVISHWWNWGSVAEERRRRRCGNGGKSVGAGRWRECSRRVRGSDGDGISGDGLADKIRSHPHLDGKS